MIAALYAQKPGVYELFKDVDLWDEKRDARKYEGPWPVVAHPPCGSWGNYAKLHRESRALGPMLGDDDGCFEAALKSLRKHGGVLEHPKGSKAYARFKIPRPKPGLGWQKFYTGTKYGHYVVEVEQGLYGHKAPKPAWLYLVLPKHLDPPPIRQGFSLAQGKVEQLSKKERAATPFEFAEYLISLAKGK